MAITGKASNEPFLKQLNNKKTPHVIITAEESDFDESILKGFRSEGFNVQYVAMGNDNSTKYSERLHAVANAYGDAASVILESHVKPTPRLIALIAYYPSAIPDPGRTSYPMEMTVLMHLAGGVVGVRRNQELLGVQGKLKTVRKRLARGLGVGGEMKLGCASYKYEGVEPGFAEQDLEDFDSIAEDLAWGRTLQVLRQAFGMKVDVEKIRDQHMEDVRANLSKALNATSAKARVLCVPTLIGSSTPEDLHRFYIKFFRPNPADLNSLLISRTVGVDRVVDEIKLSFEHNREIPWLLPGIPPTNKQVEVAIVSIVCIKGGLLSHEHVYWDQASVLAQIGLLNPNNVPQELSGTGCEAASDQWCRKLKEYTRRQSFFEQSPPGLKGEGE
ncbi:MAG: hypothetical protein LQ340_000137 [Diploschistes diacapsis]|nr:MAG: hypothetical protein LQ340_000137 [Diploschistes diacapsis]